MTGVPRNNRASWFQKKNHLALKKEEVTKPLILGTAVTRLAGLGVEIETLTLDVPPEGTEFLVDSDGRFLTDLDGNYLVGNI